MLHCISLLVVLGVGIYLCVSDRFLRPRMHIVILVAGIVCGLMVAVSGFYLMEYWSELMEHIDFTELARVEVNARRFPIGFYFLLATNTTLGAVAALVFSRLLYGHLSELEQK